MCNRRLLIAAASGVLLAGAASAQMTPAGATAGPAIRALTLALNFECLSAEYYTWVVTNVGLTPEQRGGGPPSVGSPVGDSRIGFDDEDYMALAAEAAEDHSAHVAFLRGMLGNLTGEAPPCPQVNVSPAVFTRYLQAAVPATQIRPRSAGDSDDGDDGDDDTGDDDLEDGIFNPYTDDEAFLLGGFMLADVGVSAFRGAMRPLSSIENPGVRESVISAASGMLATNAYHAGILRQEVEDEEGVVVGLANAVSNLRDSFTPGVEQDQGVRIEGRRNLVPADANGLAFERNQTEVMSVLRLGGDASPFFPSGMTPAPTGVVSDPIVELEAGQETVMMAG